MMFELLIKIILVPIVSGVVSGLIYKLYFEKRLNMIEAGFHLFSENIKQAMISSNSANQKVDTLVSIRNTDIDSITARLFIIDDELRQALQKLETLRIAQERLIYKVNDIAKQQAQNAADPDKDKIQVQLGSNTDSG